MALVTKNDVTQIFAIQAPSIDCLLHLQTIHAGGMGSAS